MVHNLSDSDSIIGNYLAELRDVQIQKDPMRFRANMERIAEIMAYEISKKLKSYQSSSNNSKKGCHQFYR